MLRSVALCIGPPGRFGNRTQLKVLLKDDLDHLRFLLVHHQSLLNSIIPENCRAAAPVALLCV
ncbi:MAG: hypothetical protein ACYTGH_13475 [Planctomycetota bacterium]